MTRSPESSLLDPSDGRQSAVIASIWRHPLLVLGGLVLGLGLALGLATMQPPVFQAESRVFLSSHEEFDPTGQRDYVSDPSRFVEQQAAVMTSAPVLEAALKAGAPAADVRRLREMLDVAASAESDIVTVRATGATPAAAQTIVDDVVQAYQARVTDNVVATVRQIESVLSPTDLQYAKKQAAVFGDGVSLVEPAAATQVSSTIRNSVVLGLAGLLLGIGLALVLDRLPMHRTAGWGGRLRASPSRRSSADVNPAATHAVTSTRHRPAASEAS